MPDTKNCRSSQAKTPLLPGALEGGRESLGGSGISMVGPPEGHLIPVARRDSETVCIDAGPDEEAPADQPADHRPLSSGQETGIAAASL